MFIEPDKNILTGYKVENLPVLSNDAVSFENIAPVIERLMYMEQ
jgi:hypothetical protein